MTRIGFCSHISMENVVLIFISFSTRLNLIQLKMASKAVARVIVGTIRVLLKEELITTFSRYSHSRALVEAHFYDKKMFTLKFEEKKHKNIAQTTKYICTSDWLKTNRVRLG